GTASTTNLTISGIRGGLLSTDMNGTVSATTSIGANLISGTLGIANGGTGASAQTTNGVSYYNGTSITSGSQFVFNGTNVGIGTTTPRWSLTLASSTGPQFALTDTSAANNAWT